MSKEQRQRAAMISLLCLRNGTVGRRVSFFQKIRERHSSMDRTGKILVTFDTTHALCLERRETNQNEGTDDLNCNIGSTYICRVLGGQRPQDSTNLV